MVLGVKTAHFCVFTAKNSQLRESTHDGVQSTFRQEKKLIEEEKKNLLENKSENKFTSDIMSLDEKTSPLVKISPNVNLNTAIGLVLGLMIGVFYVFTQEWWKNSKDDIKTRWNQYK